MLTELSSSAAVRDFIQSYPSIVVTFSAHWCGPCKASKPQLMEMAKKYAAESSTNPRVKMGIVYEENLRDEIHAYNVRGFPTHALFQNGNEKQRVMGANLASLQQMIETHCKDVMPTTGGETLGGGSANVLSPEQARQARLARLQAAPNPWTDNDKKDDDGKKDSSPDDKKKTEAMEVTKDDDDEKKKDEDVEMKDADDAKEDAAEMKDPTEDLDKAVLDTLMNEMGFPKLRAQKGLLCGNGSTVESAVEWLMEHQEDADIDEPIPMCVPATTGSGASAVAKSYKCNECGKILSNMANLELHANKTGHSDFEESTEAVKPLTPEEKAAKIEEIKELLKTKRAEREEAEKADNIDREKSRRFMGKEMAKTREQMDMEQRKREAQLRKKEKDDAKKERARLRAELAKDKAERQANKGKLTSKLGVDGYNPNVVQYDVPMEGQEDNGDEAGAVKPAPPKKSKVDVNRIDEYIAKVSGYRAGGDGGKCLKILKIYVTNALEKGHEDEKFRNINTDNKAYKAKVKPFLGAKNILLAVGFKPSSDDGTSLVLDLEDFDKDILTKTKEKLEAALVAYG